jgi:hypothetical protein
MKTIQTLAIFMTFIATSWAEEQSFKCDMESPKIRIEVPEIPQVKMAAHPLKAAQPHLRLAGSSDGYTVSVAIPTVDAGMTAKECAISLAGGLARRHKLTPDNAFFGPAGDNTFQFRFILDLGDGSYQMNSYILSGYKGTHAVNVHISKTTKDKADFDQWLKGFPKALVRNTNKVKK